MKTAIPRPLESTVLRECLAEAKRLRVPCFRRNVATVTAQYKGKTRLFRSGEPGQSDLYGWLPIWARRGRFGIHFECEIKRDGETPTYEQILWLKKCHEVTGVAFWVDNADTFHNVLAKIVEGMVIHYAASEIDYRVRIKGSRKTRVVRGPSYDFDLVW